MNVVEAIDAWIDEEIDDLTDDELEAILEILDAVSESSLANVDADDIYDEDIAELVELAGDTADEQAYAETILRTALFGEPLDTFDVEEPEDDDTFDVEEPEDDDTFDVVTEDPDNQGGAEHYDPLDLDDTDLLDTDDTDDTDLLDTDNHDDTDLLDTDNTEPLDLDDTEPLDLDDTDDTDPLDTDNHDDTERSDLDEELHVDFLSDLAKAENSDQDAYKSDVNHNVFMGELATTSNEDEPTRLLSPTVQPIEFRDFDELGPSFLPDTGPSPRRAGTTARVSRLLLPTFMFVGLAVFAFGMVQLINSLNEDDEDVAAEVELVDDPTPLPTPEPVATIDQAPPPTATVDPSAPPATPTPEPTPAPRIGIRLITGDVMLAAFPEPGGLPEFSQLYDTSNEDLAPARQIAWLADGLGIVDENGNVLLVDPDARRPRPVTIYEAGGGLGEAIEIASADERVAILTDEGDISLTPQNGNADPDVLQIVWDADEEGSRATDLTAVEGLVPFALDNGDAKMILTGGNNTILPIWTAGDQPPAFNVGGSPAGILLGVGQGAVARYNLDTEDGDDVLDSVWDPFTREDEPAIGYSSLGDDTAIVTGNGAIVLADDAGGGQVLWDPELTEIRAFIALGTDSQVVVLLETGSVVRIPLDPDQLIESIWDITDETLNPANQVIIEPTES